MLRTTVCLGRCALVGVLLSVAGTAHAYRPFDGTDGDTAEFGELELEIGPAEMVREEGRDFLLAPVGVFNLGILPRTEFVVDMVGTAPIHPEMGESRYSVDDTDVVLKFLLREGQLQDKSGPSIALEAGALTPGIQSEDEGFGATVNLIFSAKFGWFIMHLNNEAELSRKEYEFSWTNMLITEYRFNEVVWPVMEFTRGMSASESEFSALVGVIWSVADGLDIDAGWVAADVAGEPVFEARAGLTWATSLWGVEEEEAEGPESPHTAEPEDESNEGSTP